MLAYFRPPLHMTSATPQTGGMTENDETTKHETRPNERLNESPYPAGWTATTSGGVGHFTAGGNHKCRSHVGYEFMYQPTVNS